LYSANGVDAFFAAPFRTLDFFFTPAVFFVVAERFGLADFFLGDFFAGDVLAELIPTPGFEGWEGEECAGADKHALSFIMPRWATRTSACPGLRVSGRCQ
jgi:hypothetical protein